MRTITAVCLFALLLAPAAFTPGASAQTPVSDMMSSADLNRSLDPQTLASQHYTKGLGYLRKADKALEKGKSEEKMLKNLERAAEYFQNAVNQYYDIPEAHCELGCTMIRLGKLEEAQSSLTIAGAMEPGSERVKECKELLETAKKEARQEEQVEPGR